MNYYHLALVIGEFLAAGMAVFKVIDWAKLSDAFPWFTEGKTALIRSVGVALSVFSVVLISFANHSLDLSEIQNLVVAIFGILVVWGAAHTTHKITKA